MSGRKKNTQSGTLESGLPLQTSVESGELYLQTGRYSWNPVPICRGADNTPILISGK